MKRRTFLIGGTGALLIQFVPRPIAAATRDLVMQAYNGRVPTPGRVTLTAPAIAENGNSVPIAVIVESPMTVDNYVKEIRIFAPQNPKPMIATFRLYPQTGKAAVSTRMRFANSQTVTAVAEMNDGSLWSGTATTIVALAACVDPLL